MNKVFTLFSMLTVACVAVTQVQTRMLVREGGDGSHREPNYSRLRILMIGVISPCRS